MVFKGENSHSKELERIEAKYNEIQSYYKNGDIDLKINNEEESVSELTSKDNSKLYRSAQELYSDIKNPNIHLRDYLKLRCFCLVYEIGVYYLAQIIEEDDFNLSEEIIFDNIETLSQKIEDLIKKEKKYQRIDTSDRHNYKAQLRFLACKANELSRHRKYELAIKISQKIYLLVDKLSVPDEDPLHCLKGAISFVEGSALRGNYQLEDSFRKLRESCEQYAARKTWLNRLNDNQERKEILKIKSEDIEREFNFASWKTAISLGYGIGYLNYLQGYIHRACQSLAIAASMLCHKGGKSNEKYLLMQYAAARFAMTAATDHKEFLESYIKEILEYYQMFEGVNESFKIRAALEAVICLTSMEDFDKALLLVEEILVYANKTINNRLKARALSLKSRLVRKRIKQFINAKLNATLQKSFNISFGQKHEVLEESVKLNKEALLYAKDYPQVKAEVLIGLGICYKKLFSLYSQSSIDHISDTDKENTKQLRNSYFLNSLNAFNEALNVLKWDRNQLLSQSLPHAVGLCLLHKAQLYIYKDSFLDANSYFREWQLISPMVDHQRIIKFAEEVSSELSQYEQPFILQANQIELKSFNIDDLNAWKKNLEEYVRSIILRQVKEESKASGKTTTKILTEKHLLNFCYNKGNNKTKKGKKLS